MEQTYVFMTDSDSDLPYHLKEQYDIPVVYMPYALDGKEYFDDLGQTLDHKSYYDKMRNGANPVTSALNEETYLEYFEPVLKEKDLLFVAFSSKLSCTLQAVYSAREKLLKKYPERTFIVVDTLRISGPMTLLVPKAHEMYRAGRPIREVADWLEANKFRAQAYFIVDDLKYLKRGGRISPADRQRQGARPEKGDRLYRGQDDGVRSGSRGKPHPGTARGQPGRRGTPEHPGEGEAARGRRAD